MDSGTAVLSAEHSFFSSLLAGDVKTLDALLADDFLLIDVLQGAEVPKPVLLAALAAGQVRFESITPAEQRVRLYGDTPLVTGRTEMRMRFGADEVVVRSRYTHVYVRHQETWRFVSAQGTPIAE